LNGTTPPPQTGGPGAGELAERRLHYAALDLLSQPVWIFDIDLRRVHWSNSAGLAVWNAPTLAELCGRDMGVDMSESVARRLAQYQSDFIAHAASFNEQWTLYPGGRPLSLSVRFSAHRLPGGRMAMLCEASNAAAHTPDSLRSVEALLHTAVMISLYGSEGQALYRNPAARASVRDLDEPLASRIVDPREHAALLAQLRADGSATRTAAVQTQQGERWHEMSARLCRDAVTGQDAVLVSEVDISAIKRTEAQAHFLAMHDSLTGLPNRSQVMQRFEQAMGHIREAGLQAALMFIDLDHFKDINDTLGHAAGDKLLVQVAERLRSAVRGSDLVARLGGDEFLILLVSRDIRAEVDVVRERLMRSVAEPVVLGGGVEVHITPSLGVSLYPQDGRDFETLLRNADLAMYTAKDRGRNDVAFFDEGMAQVVHQRMAMEAELRRALQRDEFELHYQPIVDVGNGHIAGAEALVRWRHPTRGLVGPNDFIGLCESTGLICELGARVFGRAARQQAAWRRAGHDLLVSVNLSARQFSDPRLLPVLANALRSSGCNPGRMQVEITESLLLGKDSALLEQLTAMRTMGLAIALDDFGTGYSNLAYLQRYPITTLKIDRSFIQCIDQNRPLAEMIVSMCRLMRLAVVAEGVETAEQLAWVAGRGIEHYQGYLFSRPVAAQDFDALLAAAARAAAAAAA
jgi:diguanylate cyclase (GGDEF)-like protein